MLNLICKVVEAIVFSGINGVVMIPIREISEKLGYEVKWNQKDFSVEVSKGAKMKNIDLKYIIEKLEEKGTLEVTQDIKPIKMIEGTKRLR